MLTTDQQELIDSITAQFVAQNNTIASASGNGLLAMFEKEINKIHEEVEQFRKLDAIHRPVILEIARGYARELQPLVDRLGGEITIEQDSDGAVFVTIKIERITWFFKVAVIETKRRQIGGRTEQYVIGSKSKILCGGDTFTWESFQGELIQALVSAYRKGEMKIEKQ